MLHADKQRNNHPMSKTTNNASNRTKKTTKQTDRGHSRRKGDHRMHG
jgi:hypothetical protein